jgi:hypothetical protein
MTLAEANILLNELAAHQYDEVIAAEYEEMLDILFAEHEAMMYAAQSYDNDAIAYGSK